MTLNFKGLAHPDPIALELRHIWRLTTSELGVFLSICTLHLHPTFMLQKASQKLGATLYARLYEIDPWLVLPCLVVVSLRLWRASLVSSGRSRIEMTTPLPSLVNLQRQQHFYMRHRRHHMALFKKYVRQKRGRWVCLGTTPRHKA